MPDDDLTPTDEQVRRLLSDARHDEPMPDDVAARLDEVLAGLRVDRPPVDLAARQRRRHVRTWVLAAAAVVVIGVGANQVDWSGMSTSAGDGSDSAAAGAMDSDADGPAEVPAPEMEAGGRPNWDSARTQLDSGEFGYQVDQFRQAKRQVLKRLDGLTATTSGELSSDAHAYSGFCGIGKVGKGVRFPVRYDGERAWLVFRPAQGETQVVDLYLCGRDEPTRSITLTIP
jgi:hypothetical protein